MFHVTAVYENGVFKPSEPLTLTEGQTVRLSVQPQIKPMVMRPRTPEEAEFDRRIMACKSISEVQEVIAAMPMEDFDVVNAINESRRATGFRMPDPQQIDGGNP